MIVKEGFFDSIKQGMKEKIRMAKTAMEEPESRLQKIFYHIMSRSRSG